MFKNQLLNKTYGGTSNENNLQLQINYAVYNKLPGPYHKVRKVPRTMRKNMQM
jgi:hypothetical protein